MQAYKNKDYQILIFSDDKIREDNLSCSICGVITKDFEDLIPMQQHQCCYWCHIHFGYGENKESFESGEWRPSKEEVENKLKNRNFNQMVDF